MICWENVSKVIYFCINWGTVFEYAIYVAHRGRHAKIFGWAKSATDIHDRRTVA